MNDNLVRASAPLDHSNANLLSSSPLRSSSSPHASSSSGLSPREVTIEQVTADHRDELGEVQAVFQSSIDSGDGMGAQEPSSSGQVPLEEIPSLQDRGTRFHWYHNLFSREGGLRELLIVARHSLTNQSITQKDLEFILECCRSESSGLFASKAKCQTLGFRILHYLAENRRQLSQSAIETLILSLRELNPKNLPYVTMALGYAIFYDPTISTSEDICELLDRAIAELSQLNGRKYLEVIVIAIGAKAKLTTLTSSDLLKIQQAIGEVTDSDITPLYHPSELKSDLPRTSLLSPFLAKSVILRKIKANAQEGGILSNDELNFIVRSYNYTPDMGVRNKILQIIQCVVSNGQRRFPDSNEFAQLLKQALTDSEFKFRSLALVIANTFSVNGELDQSVNQHLTMARYRQRWYALNALSRHIQIRGSANIAADAIWIRLLEHLKNNGDENQSLRNLVSYIEFQLNTDTAFLESLLLNKEYSSLATEAYLTIARQGELIANHTVLNIAELIYHKQDYPLETVLNAIAIFRYMVENMQPIDTKVIEQAIGIVCDSHSDIRMREAALFLLGTCATHYPGNVMEEELLHAIMECLNHKKLITASCFFLARWIDIIEAPHFKKHFLVILLKIVDLLSSQDISETKKRSLTLILGKAAEKGFEFPEDLKNRIISIAHMTQEVTLQQRLGQVIEIISASAGNVELTIGSSLNITPRDSSSSHE